MPSAAPGRSASRRDTVLVLGCVVLALGTLLLPPAWTQTVALGLRESALVPFVWLQRRAEEGRTSRARLQAVMGERDSAAVALQEAGEVEAENRRLRGLLGLAARAPGRFLVAEVLHQPLPTDGRTLLLGLGAGAGVRARLPVVAPEGLVGVVSRAGPRSSIVNTWAHAAFRASAVTEDGAVLGIVAPSSAAEPSLTVLEFRGVAYRDTVPDGSLVVTAGLGGVFPRGIPIGRVSGVRREQLGWERVYRLVPVVNLGVVSHVLLLTGPEGAGAFAPRDSAP